MLYLFIRNVTALLCTYYMASNITSAESAYKFLFSLLFHKFISKVKVSAFLKMFPKIPSLLRFFLRFLGNFENLGLDLQPVL